jgi:molybdate transport system substrate-binding protein
MIQKKWLHKMTLVGLIIPVIMVVSCRTTEKETLRVAVAANLQFAIEELVTVFEADSGIPCEVILGSSGKLTAQILEGAPFDIFMSADMKYPNKIYEEGLGWSSPVVYAYGNLVLWTLREDVEPELSSLMDEQVAHIAIGNPKTAPYGVAALAVLDKTGLAGKLSNKLVFGESISQTNQFIISGAADIGFTSQAVVKSDKMQHVGHWKAIDTALYPRMAQGLILLKGGERKVDMAIRFREFIQSDKGKEILHKFGYEIS